MTTTVEINVLLDLTTTERIECFDRKEALNQWYQLKPEGWTDKWASVRVEDNRLIIRPKSSGWFEDNYGGFLYREIAGDFTVTTRIKVVGITSATPLKAFSLAGLFIRKPRQFSAQTWQRGGENWLFFSTGTADQAGTAQFEIKSTYQSISTLKTYPSRPGWMELRIVRLGEVMTLLYRYEGELSFRQLDQFIRPDLPQTLEVGLTAYSDWPSVAEIYPNYERYNVQGAPVEHADLVAYVDWIKFRRPSVARIAIANSPTYLAEFNS